MKRSTERIVTTHVGSLPRPPDLSDMIQAKERVAVPRQMFQEILSLIARLRAPPAPA